MTIETTFFGYHFASHLMGRVWDKDKWVQSGFGKFLRTSDLEWVQGGSGMTLSCPIMS